MGTKTITAIEYHCNNPQCSTIIITTKEEPPDGYGGRVDGVDASGGHSAHWWACSRPCITPAIISALGED